MRHIFLVLFVSLLSVNVSVQFSNLIPFESIEGNTAYAQMSPTTTEEAEVAECAANHYGCLAGEPEQQTEAATEWTWACYIWPGVSYVECSEPKPPVCDNTVNLGCTNGNAVAANPASTDVPVPGADELIKVPDGTRTYNWTCNVDGLAPAQCEREVDLCGGIEMQAGQECCSGKILQDNEICCYVGADAGQAGNAMEGVDGGLVNEVELIAPSKNARICTSPNKCFVRRTCHDGGNPPNEEFGEDGDATFKCGYELLCATAVVHSCNKNRPNNNCQDECLTGALPPEQCPPGGGDITGTCAGAFGTCATGFPFEINPIIWWCLGNNNDSALDDAECSTGGGAQCGVTNNTCNPGTLEDIDGPTWRCLGTNNGADWDDVVCGGQSDGACGEIAGSCDQGDVEMVTNDATSIEWNCLGSGGGNDAACVINHGVCGINSSTVIAQAFTCEHSIPFGAAIPGSPPNTLTQLMWTCIGDDGGNDANCTFTCPPDSVLNVALDACVPIVDLCNNIAGTQETVPVGMTGFPGDHCCTDPQVWDGVTNACEDPLTVSCSGAPSPVGTSSSVTWSSIAGGGIGAYGYTWSGTETLTGATASVNKTYTQTGPKIANITVTSGGQSVSETCTAVQVNNCSTTAPTTNSVACNDGPAPAFNVEDNSLVTSCSNTVQCDWVCASGYYKSGSTCVAYACQGATPSNSVLCSGDDTGLTSNPTRALVETCGAAKCEYTCGPGYTFSGGVCGPIEASGFGIDTPTDSGITSTSATLGARVTLTGTPPPTLTRIGVCWSTSSNPSISLNGTAASGSQCQADGSLLAGPFDILASGLTPDTLYHYRGYAMDSIEVKYTTDTTFSTPPGPSGTISASPNPCTIALGASTCTTGLTWSTSDLTAAATAVTTPGRADVSAATSGSGVSVTVEYVGRNFFLYHNGQQLNFVSVTAECASGSTWNGTICAADSDPIIINPTYTSITSSSAILGAEVTSAGTPTPLIRRGVCWGTSLNPSVELDGSPATGTLGCQAHLNPILGSFTIEAAGLSLNTLYHYRGYAMNDGNRVGYTADTTFSTLATGPSGTISATPNPCIISPGESTCTTDLTWTTASLTAAATAVTTPGRADVSAATSGSGVSVTVEYVGRNFFLYHNAQLLNFVSVTAECASGSTWNGTICESLLCPEGTTFVSGSTKPSKCCTAAEVASNTYACGLPNIVCNEDGICDPDEACLCPDCLGETIEEDHCELGLVCTGVTGDAACCPPGTTWDPVANVCWASPAIDSAYHDQLTSSGVTLHATVTSVGLPPPLTRRGFCWSTSVGPSIGLDGVATSGSECRAEGLTSIGTFQLGVTGLIPGTTYYYRGYAMNSYAVVYAGDSVTNVFIPPAGPNGDISATPNPCIISPGESTCTTDLTWTTASLTAAATAVTTPGRADVSAATSGSGVSVTVEYVGRNFFLYHNAQLLDSVSVTADCAPGSPWNGTICAGTPLCTEPNTYVIGSTKPSKCCTAAEVAGNISQCGIPIVCDYDNICDVNEGCLCPDCLGQQDHCATGLICSGVTGNAACCTEASSLWNPLTKTCEILPTDFNLSASPVKGTKWDGENNQWLIKKGLTEQVIYADIHNESSVPKPSGTTIPYIFQMANSLSPTDINNAVMIDSASIDGIGGNEFKNANGGHIFDTVGTYFIRICANKSDPLTFGSTFALESDPNDNCGDWSKFQVSEQFLVTFDCDGVQTYHFVPATFTPSTLGVVCEKPGSNLKQWCTDLALTQACEPTTTQRTIAGDTTFYPLWETTANYTLTYNDNDGNPLTNTVPVDATLYDFLDQVILMAGTDLTPRTGYVFVGWNTLANGLGTDYIPGAPFTILNNTTFYAKWVDENTLNGCFADSSTGKNIMTYNTALTTLLGEDEYVGYMLSDPTRSEQTKTFQTKLAGNINKYITSRYCPKVMDAPTTWSVNSPAALIDPFLGDCEDLDNVPNVNGYYYYQGSEGNRLVTVNGWSNLDGLIVDEIVGPTVLYVVGADVYIQENIRYAGTDTAPSLVIIVQKDDNGDGGNIYVNPAVTHIDGTLIADGALINGTGPTALQNWITNTTLTNRLLINGRLLTYNTRGGSLNPDLTQKVGTGVCATGSCTLAEAAAQDLERFRWVPPINSSNTCSLYVTNYTPARKPDILTTIAE